MKGNNQIGMNQSTVIAALQHYFDTVLFKDQSGASAVIVDHVEANSGSGKYSTPFLTVHTKEPETTPASQNAAQ